MDAGGRGVGGRERRNRLVEEKEGRQEPGKEETAGGKHNPAPSPGGKEVPPGEWVPTRGAAKGLKRALPSGGSVRESSFKEQRSGPRREGVADSGKPTTEPEARPWREGAETTRARARGLSGVAPGRERAGIRTIAFGLCQPPPGSEPTPRASPGSQWDASILAMQSQQPGRGWSCSARGSGRLRCAELGMHPGLPGPQAREREAEAEEPERVTALWGWVPSALGPDAGLTACSLGFSLRICTMG